MRIVLAAGREADHEHGMALLRTIAARPAGGAVESRPTATSLTIR